MKILRHVWQMIRQNRLFTAIYIFGTALAIATVTVIAVIFWAKVAPGYPEYQRDKTTYLQFSLLEHNNEGWMSSGRLSYDAIHNHLADLRNAKVKSAVYDNWEDHYIQSMTGEDDFKATAKPTDTSFFDIYTFKFLAGKPFSDADFESGLPVAVITDKTARKAFGPTPYRELIGREISLDFRKYKISGIVKEGTPTEFWSYGNIYYPYTTIRGYEKSESPWLGNYELIIIYDDLDDLRAEIENIVSRYNNSTEQYTLSLFNQPVSHTEYVLGSQGRREDFSLWGFISDFAGLLLCLLLVPALNLSGMIAGRMRGRSSEMGLRKSFGATPGTLMAQVLWENLILTLLGGILGFGFAYIALKCGITEFLNDDIDKVSVVTDEMIMAPAIFAFTFAVCAILNLMSALIPAYRSLRRPIVQSLKEK